VRFLVDAQLPPSLARWIANDGHEAQHVSEVGLLEASDEIIWTFAERTAAILLTKDEDFATRWAKGDRAVSVVWLRVGNCSRRTLINWLGPQWSQVIQLLTSGEKLIELR
jgi:predicted nuclease of predicted toxin-antitoxin system